MVVIPKMCGQNQMYYMRNSPATTCKLALEDPIHVAEFTLQYPFAACAGRQDDVCHGNATSEESGKSRHGNWKCSVNRPRFAATNPPYLASVHTIK